MAMNSSYDLPWLHF